MKPQPIAIVLILVFLAMFMPFGQIFVVKSETSTIEAKGLSYIKNVLPINLAVYNITLESSGNEYVEYSLISGATSIPVSVDFVNESIFQFVLSLYSGELVYDQPYSNIIDVARVFLERNQAFTGLDSTEMISLLEMVPTNMTDWANVNETKLLDIRSGNLVLTVSHLGVPYTYTYAQTDFRWGKFLPNGTFYTDMTMTFGGKDLVYLIDYRPLSVLDNASVNISRDKAISNAMNYLENYTYTTLEGVTVSGFDVSQSPATATLLITVRDRYLLSSCWTVLFNLTQTYPDGVNQLFVKLWADTGEVSASGNLAPTRYLSINNSNPMPTSTPALSPTSFVTANSTVSPSPTPSIPSTQTPILRNTPLPSSTNSFDSTPSSTPASSTSSSPTASSSFDGSTVYPIIAMGAIIVALVIIIAVATVALPLLRRQQ